MKSHISRHDIIILGAGPAGCSAAILLSRAGFRTLLINQPSQYPPVGESLSPGAIDALVALRLDHLLASSTALPSYGTTTYWGDDTPRDRNFLFAAATGRLIERTRFEQQIQELAGTYGQIRTCDRGVSIDLQMDAFWTARWSEGGVTCAAVARFAVDATGRSRILARRAGACVSHVDKLVGWHGLVERSKRQPLETVIRSSPSGWWYMAPLPNRQAAICYVTDSAGSSRERLSSALVGPDASAIFALCGTARSAWSPAPYACGLSFLKVAGGRNWLAIGDAALAQDPLSGHGVEFALRSAGKGAAALAAASNGQNAALQLYCEMVARRTDACINARDGVYRAEGRWSMEPFWQRRKSRLPASNASLSALDSKQRELVHV